VNCGICWPVPRTNNPTSILNRLLVQAAKSPAAKSAFYEASGTEVFTSSPEELARFQAVESKKWGAIVKEAGIEAE
jgi:tripartite-type tricarboxylate transporter receptor subunit TctC